jgi:predicted phosphodiesterase
VRIALVADTHGNLVAFEAVLADIERAQVDTIVCLGDVVASGPKPREVLHLMRDAATAVVKGNTDDFMLDYSPTPDADETTLRWETIDRWCAAQLTPGDLGYIRTFPPTVEVTLEGGTRLFCFHGSPRSYHERIIATTTDADLDPMFDGVEATVLAGGHTHQQLFRRYRSSILLNPGSVGMAYKPTPDGGRINPPWAEYAIVQSTDTSLSVDLRRVPIEREPVARALLESGMPYAEWLAEGWLADMP